MRRRRVFSGSGRSSRDGYYHESAALASAVHSGAAGLNAAAATAPADRVVAPNLINEARNEAAGRRATVIVTGHSDTCVAITDVERHSAV
jgi:hypothetical protein